MKHGWQIETLEADLPGQTRYAMAGLFSRRLDGGILGHAFEGEARLRSEQPSAFAKWWLKDVPANGRLEPFDLSGQLLVKSDRVSVSALDLDMNGDRATGQIDWYKGQGGADKAGALSIKLDAEQVDLDAVQGVGSLLLDHSTGAAAPLKDIALDVQTDRLLMGEFKGQKLAARLHLAEGGINIDRLEVGDFAGSHLTMTGALEDLAGQPKGHIEGKVRADKLDGLASLFERFLPDQPVAAWFGKVHGALAPADIAFSLDGSNGSDGVKGQISGLLGGGNVDLEGTLDGSLANWSQKALRLDLKLDNPDGGKLLSLAEMDHGMMSLPALSAHILLNGVLDKGADMTASVTSDDGALNYEGTVIFDLRDGLHSEGDVSLKMRDLTSYLLASGVPLSNPGLALPVQMTAKIDYSGDETKIDALSGAWDDQPVVGSLSYEEGVTNRKVTGQLELGTLTGFGLGRACLVQGI